MTRATPSALVLDGDEVKLRIQAERNATKTPVHVDWVRFTVQRRHCPTPEADFIFPPSDDAVFHELHSAFLKAMRDVPDCDTTAGAHAMELAHRVAGALGSEFVVCPEPRKGHDFYRFRYSIERHGTECGWVGFLSSSDSPRQAAQSRTIHANVYGAACTFADHGWNHRIADLIEAYQGDLTRADLALDFFDGLPGGIERLDAEYDAGLIRFGGKLPVIKHLGDWSKHSKGERSLYLGSKEAGKQTNAYEKGDQLYGVGASKWLRVELRYGNKLRVLPADMLRRPSDFFAGASEWHAALCSEAEALGAIQPEPVATKSPLALQTVKAEAFRAFKWITTVAGPSIAEFVRGAPLEAVLGLSETTRRPGRLGKFSASEVQQAFAAIFSTAGEPCPVAA